MTGSSSGVESPEEGFAGAPYFSRGEDGYAPLCDKSIGEERGQFLRSDVFSIGRAAFGSLEDAIFDSLSRKASYFQNASDQPVLLLLGFCPLTYTLDETSEEKGKLFLTSLATNSCAVGI